MEITSFESDGTKAKKASCLLFERVTQSDRDAKNTRMPEEARRRETAQWHSVGLLR